MKHKLISLILALTFALAQISVAFPSETGNTDVLRRGDALSLGSNAQPQGNLGINFPIVKAGENLRPRAAEERTSVPPREVSPNISKQADDLGQDEDPFIEDTWGDVWRGYKLSIFGDNELGDSNLPGRTQDTLGCATLILGNKDPNLKALSDSGMYDTFIDDHEMAAGERDRLEVLQQATGRDDIKFVPDLGAVLATIDSDPLDTVYLVDRLPNDEEEEKFRKYFLDKYEVGYFLVVIDGREYFVVEKTDFDEEEKVLGIIGSVSGDRVKTLKDFKVKFWMHIHHTKSGILPSVLDYIKTFPLISDRIPSFMHVNRFYISHPVIGFVEYFYEEDRGLLSVAANLEQLHDFQITTFTGRQTRFYNDKTEPEAVDILMNEIDRGCWGFDVEIDGGYHFVWREGWKFSDIVKGCLQEPADNISHRLIIERLAELDETALSSV